MYFPRLKYVIMNIINHIPNNDLDKLFSVIISLFVSINIYVNLDKLLLNCYPYNLICNEIGLYAISFVLSR